MRFRKKPIEIEAVRVMDVRKGPLDPYLRLLAPYGAVMEVYNRLHDSWIKVRPGDWINITDINDLYPIAESYFHEHYEACG